MNKNNRGMRMLKSSEIEVLSNALMNLLKATQGEIHNILSYTPGEKISQECQEASEYFLDFIRVIINHPSLGTPDEILHLPLKDGKTRAEIILSGNMEKIQEINSLLFVIDRGDFS